MSETQANHCAAILMRLSRTPTRLLARCLIARPAAYGVLLLLLLLLYSWVRAPDVVLPGFFARVEEERKFLLCPCWLWLDGVETDDFCSDVAC